VSGCGIQPTTAGERGFSMSTSVELRGPPPAARPLDDAVWQAWIAKGRAQDRRSSAARIRAVKWASVVGLLIVAGFWSHLAAFEVVVRFLVTASAIVMVFQAFRARHYAVAAVFGALALFYSPVVPAFNFSGAWQRAAVVASTVPFVASLVWRNAKKCEDGTQWTEGCWLFNFDHIWSGDVRRSNFFRSAMRNEKFREPGAPVRPLQGRKTKAA
jgi:hypothetical protein